MLTRSNEEVPFGLPDVDGIASIAPKTVEDHWTQVHRDSFLKSKEWTLSPSRTPDNADLKIRLEMRRSKTFNFLLQLVWVLPNKR